MIGFVVYLMVVLSVGIVAYRRTSTQAGFILGDRKLGPWVIAFSERASGESAWLLLGVPGTAFMAGFIELWTAIGCATGIFLSWTVVAKKLRREVGHYDSLTIPDYFRSRYPETHEFIRIASSLIIVFFYTFYVASQFNGAGKVLDETFGELLLSVKDTLGLSVSTVTMGMVVGAIIVLFYTAMGGFVAVAWTDLVQGIIMVFTCVTLPILGWFMLGGTELLDNIRADDPNLLSMTGGKPLGQAFLGIVGGLSWGLGYMGQPHLLTRFMAIRSVDDIRTSKVIATWWAVPALWGATLIGIVGSGAYGRDFFDDPERIMPFMAQDILPGWLAGIMISGAIAAMMSTADSQLLVTTSTLSEDIYHKTLKRSRSPESLAVFSRIATVVIGLVAFWLAVESTDTVRKMVSFAWSGLAAAFAPGLVLTLWWKRTTGYGVLTGMIGGTLTVVLWNLLGLNEYFTERVSGVAIAALLVVGVSLLGKQERDDATV